MIPRPCVFHVHNLLLPLPGALNYALEDSGVGMDSLNSKEILISISQKVFYVLCTANSA